MIRWSLLAGFVSVALAHTAWASNEGVGISESTDPARAAAVERKARELRQRAVGAPTVGIVRGVTAQGDAFLSGGITVEDRVEMHAERLRYALWVATVAKPSGAYLSDARLRIERLPDRATVLERTMDGPWLMVALPAGRYAVRVSLKTDGDGRVLTSTQQVGVPAKGQRQAVFRFESSAEVSPEMQSPFKGNPFGKPGG